MSGIPGFQRRSPRVETEHEAILTNPEGREIGITVTQLSAGGFRLSAGEMLVVGDKVRIRVAHYGDFPAEIRWATESEAGGVFLEPVRLNAL